MLPELAAAAAVVVVNVAGPVCVFDVSVFVCAWIYVCLFVLEGVQDVHSM